MFTSFFKIFFLVVTIGLFHGLVVLPVLLSLAGPAPNAVDAVVVDVDDDEVVERDKTSDKGDQKV